MSVIAFPVPTLAEVVGLRLAPELTEAERAIAQGVADGRAYALIGIGLGMTEVQVHAAVTALMRRLECPTPAAAVAHLMRAGRIR